jgi:putative ABC transport system permease protein
VQYQGFADINMGIGIVILGLGSVMIGEMLVNWMGSNSIMLKLAGVIIGSILFRLILAFTLSIGMNPILLQLVTASCVLIVVGLPNLKRSK